jgi:acyl-CoA reductase-like NAD-dependent aldehyde dehydrogenase
MKLAVTFQQSPETNIEQSIRLRFEVGAAARRARAAQAGWRLLSVAQRLGSIRRLRHLLADEAGPLSAVLASQLNRSQSELLTSEFLPLIEACRFLERRAAVLLAPRKVSRTGRPLWLWGAHSRILREPMGLILVIGPSNYPLFLPGAQMVQALTAGNGVLLKPGSGGSRAAKVLVDLCERAGVPAGLLAVLPEEVDSAQEAIRAGVDKVFLTGGVETGRAVLGALAPHLVPSVMELSGCDAAIVRADADLDLTARALCFGQRLNRGATCIAPRRVLVARAVATELEGRLARLCVARERIVFSNDHSARLGPLIQDALERGAHLVAGSVREDAPLEGPVLLGGVPTDCPLLNLDVFAPVMSIVTVADDDEAVRLANNSDFALGATVFSRDLVGAQRVAERINSGVVVINDMIVPTADPRLPFGGRKHSGFGVTRGAEGLLEFTAVKVITARSGGLRKHLYGAQSSDAPLFLALINLIHGHGWRNRARAIWQLVQFGRRRN